MAGKTRIGAGGGPRGTPGTARRALRTGWRAILWSAFSPRRLLAGKPEYHFVARYGWTLIVVRWTYYSVLFQFRDYHGRWAPFVAPPFGLSVDTYAGLQGALALPFGLALMSVLALGLVAYTRLLGRTVPFTAALGILGTTFFLPFVLVQPVDQLLIAFRGWALAPVVALHSAVLVWEAWTTMEIVGGPRRLGLAERLGGAAGLSAAWILIAGWLWR